MLPTFSKNLTLQEELKTAAQVNEELIRTEFDSAFYKKTLIIFALDVKNRCRK